MRVHSYLLSVTLAATILSTAGCLQQRHMAVTPELTLVETVELPTRILQSDEFIDTYGENELVILDGGEDELPIGPQGFDVLDGGGFVVADPLRSRLAFFDSTGTYLASCRLELPAMSVTRVGNQFEVRDLKSGKWYRARLLEGEVGSECIVEDAPEGSVGVRAAEEGGDATLNRSLPNTGTIDWTVGSRADRTPLQVTWESDTTNMVSLQGIGPVAGSTRALGDELMVVAVEAARSAETIQLTKEIQVYDTSNRLVASVPNLSIDYLIAPVNEFRVHGTRLYQFYPKREGIRINVWSLDDE